MNEDRDIRKEQKEALWECYVLWEKMADLAESDPCLYTEYHHIAQKKGEAVELIDYGPWLDFNCPCCDRFHDYGCEDCPLLDLWDPDGSFRLSVLDEEDGYTTAICEKSKRSPYYIVHSAGTSSGVRPSLEILTYDYEFFCRLIADESLIKYNQMVEEG